jgi:hypothetical protein
MCAEKMIPCTEPYPNPDSCPNCGDREDGVHTNLNQSKARANFFANKINTFIPSNIKPGQEI